MRHLWAGTFAGNIGLEWESGNPEQSWSGTVHRIATFQNLSSRLSASPY